MFHKVVKNDCSPVTSLVLSSPLLPFQPSSVKIRLRLTVTQQRSALPSKITEKNTASFKFTKLLELGIMQEC